MKVTVLSDNRYEIDGFETEHGLSVYVETPTYKYLLDTGASGIFISNAEKAGIDLSQVDYVFVSHGHSDHAGGLKHFLNINSKAKIVLSKFALNQHFYSKRTGLREIGFVLDTGAYEGRFLYVEDGLDLPAEVSAFKPDSDLFAKPQGNVTLFTESGDKLDKDPFLHEIITTIDDQGLFVFTGCAHHGLLNMLETVVQRLHRKPDFVLGGFHLIDSNETYTFESEADIELLAAEIKREYPDILFFTGHCTGDYAVKILQKELKDKFHLFYAGFRWNF